MGRWITLTSIALALAAGCAPPSTTASAEASRPDALEMVARRGSFQPKLLLSGALEAVNAERITVPRTPLWQLPVRWMVDDGVTVSEGDRVLELENSQFTGELAQKRLARSSSYNDLARKKADVAVDLADKEYALEERRVARDKAQVEADVPAHLRPQREYQEDQLELARAKTEYEKALDDLESTREVSTAELDELRVELERASGEIRTAEEAISSLTLHAPRDGILVVAENRGEGRKYQIGDTVWVGLEVMRIPDLSLMKVIAQLSDVDDGRVRVGARARCTLDAYPERSYAGRVTDITPVAQEEDNSSLRRFFRVVVLLDESDSEQMRPGMSVKVEVLPEPVENALLVPRAALDLSGETPQAQLAGGDSVEVRLGPCGAQVCVVEDGLEEGARLGVTR